MGYRQNQLAGRARVACGRASKRKARDMAQHAARRFALPAPNPLPAGLSARYRVQRDIAQLQPDIVQHHPTRLRSTSGRGVQRRVNRFRSTPPRPGSARFPAKARGRSPRSPQSMLWLAILVVLALAVWWGVQSLGWWGQQDAADLLADDQSESAQQLLALTVDNEETRAAVPDYDRDEFGESWADTDYNGCDTRNDVLARDLTATTVDADRCVVLTGILQDPYSGEEIRFQRGQSTSSLVQIDHVVPLADAWQAGAWQWSALERLQFANDFDNLLAVDGSLNQQKGAGAADEWVPPNQDFQCAYAQTQIAVKTKWNLSVTEGEKNELAELLTTCS